ncbi:hypothetical protein GW17_00028103 [Ensete ventricosum]|nr:hypothetical protein GW17_00028103 [Ensete ventricosum]
MKQKEEEISSLWAKDGEEGAPSGWAEVPQRRERRAMEAVRLEGDAGDDEDATHRSLRLVAADERCAALRSTIEEEVSTMDAMAQRTRQTE